MKMKAKVPLFPTKITSEDKTIVLRKLRISDAKEFYEQHKEIVQHIGPRLWLKAPKTLGAARKEMKLCSEQWRKRRRFRYGITLKGGSDKIIGDIGVKNIDAENRSAELGYYVAKKYWGTGLIYGVINLMLNFLFTKSKIKFNRIWFKVEKENIRSCRSLEKLGAVREGVLREYFIINGRPTDMVFYSVLHREFKTKFKTKRRRK